MLKTQLLNQVMAAKVQVKDDQKKRNFIKKRNDMIQMMQAGIPIHKNLLMPQY